MSKDDQNKRQEWHISTRITQLGRNPFDHFGFINTPTYRGSTVLFPNVEKLETLGQNYTYGTKGTPTTRALEQAWTELSGAHDTVLVPSGLAAIDLALITATRAGAHILVTDSVYQPTRSFCDTILKKFGVIVEYYDPLIGKNISSLIRPDTTAILVESPGSQSMEIQDVPAISSVAQAHDICVILDNTWATPLFYPPHQRGADIAIEAGTKYLSGHSDILIGLISANERWSKRLRSTFNSFAIGASPDDASLALRGLRTMALRLRAQERAGLEIARWFNEQSEVAQVLHPALPDHPGHHLWQRDYLGSSGVFSVIFKPVEKKSLDAFINSLQLFGIGFSWGGYESLVLPFDCQSYRTATHWKTIGPAVRFSIGLEDSNDLIKDLRKGLNYLSL
ncbi:MAG: cystathionine beta-lyase [Methylocystaceae bacterium]|nr:cystathionine beta-lyase [Methylocystaceae bacterium]